MDDDLSDLTPQVWVVDHKTWNEIMERLNQPPKDIPGLKKLMKRKPPWEDDEHK